MISAADWQIIQDSIGAASGRRFQRGASHPVGGGSINQAFRLTGDGGEYFVKCNRVSGLAMFEAEIDGLRELAAARAVRVPQTVCSGVTGSISFLVLEVIEMGRPSSVSHARMGEQLAMQHRVTQKSFGWWRDNTIGSTPQINHQADSWVAFWREQRLGYQLRLAAENGQAGRLVRLGETLMAEFESLFDGYCPMPALLHGDLWGGNAAADADGHPVIYDPAVYYGDRETDLAMTELFGGFGREFYAAYRAAYPLDSGYPVRRDFYNLYHVLNHLNLFGGGYRSQAESIMERLLSEIR